MFYFITDLALRGVWFIGVKTTDLGYWMLFGTPETKFDLIMKKLEDQSKEISALKEKIVQIKETEGDELIKHRPPLSPPTTLSNQ